MKSPKPNDPTRLRVKSYGKPKAGKYGDTLIIPTNIEYSTWCCAEAHEYAHAFKCISDLFENAEEFRERSINFAAQLEYIAEKLSFTAPATPAEQEEISRDLLRIAERLSAVYKEDQND